MHYQGFYFWSFYFKVQQNRCTKNIIFNTKYMDHKIQTRSMYFALHASFHVHVLHLYIYSTNTPLIPLSVRLKHPSLSPDRESAPHCKTIALGWYISITLVITYQVIHKTYDSYAELKNSWKYIVLELTSMKRICEFKHITFKYLLYCLCENMIQVNNISLSFKTIYMYMLATFSKLVYM